MDFSLHGFQLEDVDKIERAGSGAIGSEMGTGKTHEAIELDERWWSKAAGPTLVVAPLNTHSGWERMYGLQKPDVDVVRIDRKDRDGFLEKIRKRQGDVFVCHWDVLRLSDMQKLRGVPWNLVIADEAHRASNRKNQQTLALKKIPAKHKLAMSGSMAGDKPDGLWSVYNWLWPQYYRSYWAFRKRYCIEDSTNGYRQITGANPITIRELEQERTPWWVRHLKREQCCPHHPEGVMPWLPDRVNESVIEVELSPKQRTVYEQMKQHMVSWVNEHEDEALVAGVVVAQLARLSQMTLATPRIDTVMKWERTPDGGRIQVPTQVVNLELPSTKLEALYELLKDNGSKQFVVFSASKKILYLGQKFLNERGISSYVLSGDTPEGQREGMVQRFVQGGAQVFFLSIAAAGEGIDGLQYATDTCVFLDRHWAAWRNKQAEDRLDRPGQKSGVHVIDLVARDTVDAGRVERVIQKWSDVRLILGDRKAA
jgi:SNF2 family DNA or RNA helicase